MRCAGIREELGKIMKNLKQQIKQIIAEIGNCKTEV
jgi:hypothetical protein